MAKTTKKTTTKPKTDPNAVTWNPDGSYNKGGKTYKKQTMSSRQYLSTLRGKRAQGQQLSPQEQTQYNNLMKIYYGPHTRGGKTGAGDTPRETYGEYDIEIPNYGGSTAATPKTTTKKTTTTPAATGPTAEELRAQGIAGAEATGATELARLLKNKGITDDTYGVTEDFNRLLKEASGKVPGAANYNAADISKYYNYEDIFNQAYNTSTERGRNTYQQQLNQLTPEGWQSQYFADTADDPVLQAILGQQYGETQGNLQRQLERGQISQGAYDYALQQMGANDPNAYSGLAAKAYQELQGTGGGVLGGYRSGLTEAEKNFQGDVTGYSLGQNIGGTDYWKQELDRLAGGYRSGMEGDIRRAIGGTQYFDPYSLVSKAGSVTGGSNNPLTGNVSQGTGSVLQTDDQQRTTGTSGVF